MERGRKERKMGEREGKLKKEGQHVRCQIIKKKKRSIFLDNKYV